MCLMEQDEYTITYLKMVKSSYGHTYSVLYLLTKSEKCFTRAENLFKLSASLGVSFGKIQLAHFYAVHEKFTKA